MQAQQSASPLLQQEQVLKPPNILQEEPLKNLRPGPIPGPRPSIIPINPTMNSTPVPKPDEPETNHTPQNGAVKPTPTTEPTKLVSDPPKVPITPPEPNKQIPKSDEPPLKTVNPLRLARPLEAAKASAGLSRTAIPPTRPMPLPTVSPLCPPGKPGQPPPTSFRPSQPPPHPKPGANPPKPDNSSHEKPSDAAVASPKPTLSVLPNATQPVPPKTNQTLTPSADKPPAMQPLKANPPPEIVQQKADTEKKPEETPESLPDGIKPSTPSQPVQAVPSHVSITKISETKLTATVTPPKSVQNKLTMALVPPKKSLSPIPSNAAPPTKSPPPEKFLITPKPISELTKPEAKVEKASPKEPPTPVRKPKDKVQAAEKTPRQKRKRDPPPPPPEEDKRTSKRSRQATSVYEAPDPEMAQILKAIQKQEEEERKAAEKAANKDTVKQAALEENPDVKNTEALAKEPAVLSVKKTEATNVKKPGIPTEAAIENDLKQEVPNLKPEKKAKKIIKTKELNENKAVKSERKKAEVKAVSLKETPEKVSAPKTKPSSGSKAKEAVFFKNEHLAVRNADGGFYICQTLQNIYRGSHNIKILWLSNEAPVIKQNPNNDIFGEDFYDKTDFETILSSVEMIKVSGRNYRYKLPEEEQTRINHILQKAMDKAEGKLDESSLQLTEDNPDGLDISIYTGEDQLDELEKKREEKDGITKRVSPKRKSPKQKKSPKRPKKTSDVKLKISTGNKRTLPKEDASVEISPKKQKKEKGDEFDFNDDSEEEVMPIPKKRSQDLKYIGNIKQKEEGTAASKDLSTSEKAILAEKEKMEAEEKAKLEAAEKTKNDISEKAKSETKEQDVSTDTKEVSADTKESENETNEKPTSEQSSAKKGRKPKGKK